MNISKFIYENKEHFLGGAAFLEFTNVPYFTGREWGLVVFVDWQVLCPIGVKFEGMLRILNCLCFVTVDDLVFFYFLDVSVNNAAVAFYSLDFL